MDVLHVMSIEVRIQWRIDLLHHFARFGHHALNARLSEAVIIMNATEQLREAPVDVTLEIEV
jgi:hypothetical protein